MLGRARDELYSVLDEKEKVQSQSKIAIGELQKTVKENREGQERMDALIKQISRRIRSLEQPGNCSFQDNKMSDKIMKLGRRQFGPWIKRRYVGTNAQKGISWHIDKA